MFKNDIWYNLAEYVKVNIGYNSIKEMCNIQNYHVTTNYHSFSITMTGPTFTLQLCLNQPSIKTRHSLK